MDDLRVLALKAGDEELLQCFPEGLLRRWLDYRSPEFVLQRIQQSQRTLEELRVMEKRADTNVLRALFESGEMCVRGYDKKGKPIMWGRHPKNALKLRPPYTEVCLYHMWILTLNCRRRRDPESAGIALYNEFDRKLLDFNVQFAREIVRFISGLGVDLLHSNTLMFIPNPMFASIANLCISFFRSIRSDEVTASIRADREEFLRELQDPNDIPESFLPHGKAFHLSFEVAGNWRDLVERKNAFENMTLRDIFFPDPEEFEAIRRQVEKEESQISSSMGRTNFPETAPCGSSGHESDGSDYESIASDGDFLM